MLKENIFKNYIYPVAVFCGGMVGVGFLSLPYVAMKGSIFVMLAYFLVVTFLVVVINKIFCEISLKTPDYKRFPGFVGYHLGKKVEIFTLFLTVIGTLGILLAYLVVAGDFLTAALQPIFHLGTTTYVFLFFVVVTTIIYFDIKMVARVEFWVLIALFASLVLVFFEGFSKINLSNLFVASEFKFSNLFLPYGPLLFALWGSGLIPETEEMLASTGQSKKKLKKIVITSTILVSIFYFLFVLLVLSLTGLKTEQAALTGLKNVLGNSLVCISLLVGTLSVLTAFICQGLIFKKTLIYDLKIKPWQALVMTCFTPMILFLLGLKSFVPILSFTGGVILGIDGILILLMYKKIGGKNIVIYPLSLVFLFGAIYQIINFIYGF